MHRVLPAVLLTVLAITLAAGCSRQPHVGEWETNIHGRPGYVMQGENYIFLANGDIQLVKIRQNQPESVAHGKYKIDYSKDPIQIDIKWESGTLDNGIIRFIGEDKGVMEMKTSDFGLAPKNRRIELTFEGPHGGLLSDPRPVIPQNISSIKLLTKKVKK